MKFEMAAEKLYSKLLEEDGKFYRKRQVYPNLNKDGSVNWFNFVTGGSWTKLLITLFVIGIIIGFVIENHNNFKECTEVMSKYNLEKNLSIQFEDESLKQITDSSKIIGKTKSGEQKINSS